MIHISETVDNVKNLDSAKDFSSSKGFNAKKSKLSLTLSAPILINGAIDDIALRHHFNKHTFNVSNRPLPIEIGVDEVGRGPLYGSVVIAAVILPAQYSGLIEQQRLKGTALSSLTDSKKLTETKRKRLLPLIKQHALAYMTIEVPASIIDDINILQATLTGMRLACEHLMVNIVTILSPIVPCYTALKYRVATQDRIASQYCLLSKDHLPIPDNGINDRQFKLLIDGNKIPQLDWQHLANHQLGQWFAECIVAEAWVKGDARHTAIAAASVLAKVTRDRQLIKESLANPGYGFDSHKGYPTKAHIKAIQTLGVLKQHRRSFKPVKQALELMSASYFDT